MADTDAPKRKFGGRQPGAGRPMGSVGPATLAKQAIRDHVQAKVAAALDGLVDAQIANAKGLSYLVKRDPDSGKFERIGPAGIHDEGVIEVWEKDPSVQAFTDLMNRAADKPKEQALEMQISGTLRLEDLVAEARKRVEKP